MAVRHFKWRLSPTIICTLSVLILSAALTSHVSDAAALSLADASSIVKTANGVISSTLGAKVVNSIASPSVTLPNAIAILTNQSGNFTNIIGKTPGTDNKNGTSDNVTGTDQVPELNFTNYIYDYSSITSVDGTSIHPVHWWISKMCGFSSGSPGTLNFKRIECIALKLKLKIHTLKMIPSSYDKSLYNTVMGWDGFDLSEKMDATDLAGYHWGSLSDAQRVWVIEFPKP